MNDLQIESRVTSGPPGGSTDIILQHHHQQQQQPNENNMYPDDQANNGATTGGTHTHTKTLKIPLIYLFFKQKNQIYSKYARNADIYDPIHFEM